MLQGKSSVPKGSAADNLDVSFVRARWSYSSAIYNMCNRWKETCISHPTLKKALWGFWCKTSEQAPWRTQKIWQTFPRALLVLIEYANSWKWQYSQQSHAVNLSILIWGGFLPSKLSPLVAAHQYVAPSSGTHQVFQLCWPSGKLPSTSPWMRWCT